MFKRSIIVVSLLVSFAVIALYLYARYDHWRWESVSDIDLIASIAASLPSSSAHGRKVVVISNVDENQYQLLRGYAGISPEADYILEPKDLKDLARMLMILAKGEPISRLTFFGHGILKPGSVALSFTDYAQEHEINARSFIELQKSHGNLPSAFAADAQVVFFNCFAGRDESLMQAAGEAFLSLKGGTVIANRDRVSFDISYGGDLGSRESAIILRLDRPLDSDDWEEKEF